MGSTPERRVVPARRASVAVGLGAGLLALAGCSNAPKAPPPAPCPPPPPPPPPPPLPPLVIPERRMQLLLLAGTDMNRDEQGRATPLRVRVYLLNKDLAFANAPFMSLFQNDQALLGDTVIWRQEAQLLPGASEKYARVLPDNAVALAVFAAFRDSERAVWRAMLPMPAAPMATRTPPSEPVPVPLVVRLDAAAVRATLV